MPSRVVEPGSRVGRLEALKDLIPATSPPLLLRSLLSSPRHLVSSSHPRFSPPPFRPSLAHPSPSTPPTPSYPSFPTRGRPAARSRARPAGTNLLEGLLGPCREHLERDDGPRDRVERRQQQPQQLVDPRNPDHLCLLSLSPPLALASSTSSSPHPRSTLIYVSPLHHAVAFLLLVDTPLSRRPRPRSRPIQTCAATSRRSSRRRRITSRS